MRVSKIYSALLIGLLAVGFVACNNTVSSTDASKNDGLDYIPGFDPGKADSTKTNKTSSSSTQDGSSDSEVESSASDESSSSVDFSKSKIPVDESGVAVITDEYIDADVSAATASKLDDLKAQLDDNEDVSGFSENSNMRFSVDDLNYSANEYYCYTESQEWYGITKETLLESNLPFLWDGEAYDARAGFILDFSNICQSVYIKKK